MSTLILDSLSKANALISDSKDDFVIFLYHSSIIKECILSREEFMNDNKCNVSYTNYFESIGNRHLAFSYIDDELFQTLLLDQNAINISTMMFRREIFNTIGLLDMTVSDPYYDFILRACKFYRFIYHDIFSVTQEQKENIFTLDDVKYKNIKSMDKVDIIPIYSNSPGVLDQNIRILAHKQLDLRCYKTAEYLMELT